MKKDQTDETRGENVPSQTICENALVIAAAAVKTQQSKYNMSKTNCKK